MTATRIIGRKFSNGMGILLLIVGSVAATAATLFAQRPAAQGYAITDLGTLGGTSSEASGLNNLGDVVGASTTASAVPRAFLYRNGLMFDLGTLPGGSASHATAINDRGDIVGYSGINDVWSAVSRMDPGICLGEGRCHALGALYADARSTSQRPQAAPSRSQRGQIVCDSETNEASRSGMRFSGRKRMRDLGAEVGPGSSYAVASTTSTKSSVPSTDAHSLRDGLSQELGVLPGHTSSEARAINNKGQVVGNSVTADGISHAFLWNLGTMRNLGTLPGDSSSQAQALNVGGDVVGRSGVADLSAARAVIWQGGVAIDLNRLVTSSGWMLTSATGSMIQGDCRPWFARRSVGVSFDPLRSPREDGEQSRSTPRREVAEQKLSKDFSAL